VSFSPLSERYRGRFGLHVFLAVDETMPVWEDAEAQQFEARSGSEWKHVGMDSDTARELAGRTLRETRWRNDSAVLRQWQLDYQNPLAPELDKRSNRRLEKLIERLAFVRKDWGAGSDSAARCRSILDEMATLGVHS